MKKIIFFLNLLIVLMLATSCGKIFGGKESSGMLVGVNSGKVWNDPKPFGMTYIEGGSFLMGPNDQSAQLVDVPEPRAVSISSFWMDQSEITNSEYRQFTNWVTDSIARSRLADPSLGAHDEFYMKNKNKNADITDDIRPLDWNRKIPWDNKKADEGVTTAIKDLYYQGGDILQSATEINYAKINYQYRWFDWNAAALPENKFDVNNGGFSKSAENMPIGADSADYFVRKDTSYFDGNKIITRSFYTPLTSRSAFIQTRIINIYPDTMCWMRDYSDSYNEPLTKMYFNHPGYSQYPVVGVSWSQAVAFCDWRTQLQQRAMNSSKKTRGMNIPAYILPSEAQWEYAARGGKDQALYPWGGNYIRNKNGCFLANYKPLRGRYSDDGFEVTCAVQSYPPNDYGLYDMAGNVAEWTADRYDESSYELMHDMNPSYQYNAKKSDPEILKRKVVRGGSWKDIGYYLQCGTRNFEYQDETRSYIGFRCIKTYVGAKLFKQK